MPDGNLGPDLVAVGSFGGGFGSLPGKAQRLWAGDPIPVVYPTGQPRGHSPTGVSSLLTGAEEGCFWGKQRMFPPKSPEPRSFSTPRKDRLHPMSPASSAASLTLKEALAARGH